MKIIEFFEDVLFKLESICWRVYDFYRNNYFDKKYSKRKPQIYYDKKYKNYVHPYINDITDIETLCSDLVMYSITYNYELNGKLEHVHTISEVFICAYNNSEIFFIPEDCKNEYSQQELIMIEKIVRKGKGDRANSK